MKTDAQKTKNIYQQLEGFFKGVDPSLKPPRTIHHNVCPAQLVEMAFVRGEGRLASTGAFIVNTKKWSGRSPRDRYIVRDDLVRDTIHWGKVNVAIEEADYKKLKTDMAKNMSHPHKMELFVTDVWAAPEGMGGKRVPIRIISKLACHSLFAATVLWKATKEESASFGTREDLVTIVADPDFFAEPNSYNIRSETAIVLAYKERVVLVGASLYNGEIKKSVFTFLNYIYPQTYGVFPMHCSCNQDPVTKESALFFGLSGTGKTTLSADENRDIIGDDEHGWTEEGTCFNFEAGCFAKTINVTEESEPIIFRAAKFGAIVENVPLGEDTREMDFFNTSLTENTRCSYPLSSIPNAEMKGMTEKAPNVVIFLCADAFGVMPPVARLDRNGARYHFMTGYTAKLAGTERGVTEPVATFSTCFGAPFMPLASILYADMLMEKMDKFGSRVYLVNTGWTGGPAVGSDAGHRMKLKWTRQMVTACMNDTFDKHGVEWRRDEIFNLNVPTSVPESDVPNDVLNPVNTWKNKAAFHEQANRLAKMFAENAEKMKMPAEVMAAGPRPKPRE